MKFYLNHHWSGEKAFFLFSFSFFFFFFLGGGVGTDRIRTDSSHRVDKNLVATLAPSF